jgi:hypothetical protein
MLAANAMIPRTRLHAEQSKGPAPQHVAEERGNSRAAGNKEEGET